MRLVLLAVLAATSVVRGDSPDAAVPSSRDEQEPNDAPRFADAILPVLMRRCVECHGGERAESGLRLDSLAAFSAGSENGAVVTAGDASASLIFQKIRDGEMPPEGDQLADAEVESLRRWIEDGREIRQSQAARPVTQHDILPLLRLRCTVCHGGRRREADLDMRTRDSLLAGGKSGAVVVPGDPSASRLLQRIHAGEMPPRRELVTVSVKPMEPAEIARLEAWISAGLPESTLPPDVAGPVPDTLVTDEDRQFWSFQPPRASPPPLDAISPADRNLVNNSIDVFVMAKRREQGIPTPPTVERITYMRRLSFDLLGLPPTPSEVDAFLADTEPGAVNRLVDRMLASPRYGERWGRHWLDVAGYADSEGAQNEDRVRPYIWRYRDYVVRAFNSDKPYDRFLHQQLAGDELAPYEDAPLITDEIYDNLAATGFLRTAPDRTFAGITNFVPDRLEVIADEVQVLGTAVMGLTLQCARCHSHKFDPIPQRDYYRLAAALKDALDEHDWLGPQERFLPYVTTEEREAWSHHERRIDSQIEELKKQQESLSSDEGSNGDARMRLESEIKRLESMRLPEPRIRALWSRGEPSPTYILNRGDYLTRGREVGPGVPSALTDGRTAFMPEPPWPGAKTTGRRLALARWLTDSSNPLTARVIVNRVWMHHFGQGLVSTPGNFGRAGSPPSHPELLDWLAVEFVRQGWSIKALHRLIVTSHTYRITSRVTSQTVEVDPDNLAYTRMPLRRIEAEAIRDSLLFVAGELANVPFGPPDDVDVREDGLVTPRVNPTGPRRSIYLLHRRTKLPSLLDVFDSPQMSPNCLARRESIAAPQALQLLNDKWIYDLADRFASRIEREAGDDCANRVHLAYQYAFSRPPSDEETGSALTAIRQLESKWSNVPSDAGSGRLEMHERATIKAGNGEIAGHEEASHRALRSFCHALFNSAEFIYVD